jgi:hypothetical protein
MFPKFLGPICNNKKSSNNDQTITDDFTYVLNDYCFKQLLHNDFKAISYFCPLWLKY